MTTEKRWVRCPNKRCENGAVFERSLMRFVSCERCGGHGAVEVEPRWWHVFMWADVAYVAFCVALIVLTWWVFA